MKYPNNSIGNTLTNEVKIDRNMLRALVLDGIGGHKDDTHNVTINQCSLRKGNV